MAAAAEDSASIDLAADTAVATQLGRDDRVFGVADERARRLIASAEAHGDHVAKTRTNGFTLTYLFKDVAVVTLIAVVGAWVANLPWSSTWTRVDLIGGAGIGERLGVWRALAGGGTGRWYDLLALGLWVPLLAAVLVSRAWRMTWAARAAL